MNDNRKEIELAFNEYMTEANLFWDKGNKSAGTRARAAALKLKNLMHAERTAIQEQKNAMAGK